MNKAIFTILLAILTIRGSAQRIYFIYLQNESQQPFFVKMDGKVLSSGNSNYLILSRLKDSVYRFSLGFGNHDGAEPEFVCAINKKDHGYLIRNMGEKGWALYDLQTSSLQTAVNEPRKALSEATLPVNAFTELLAKAADDPSLKQKNVLPEETKDPAKETVAIKKEEVKPGPGNNNVKTTLQDTAVADRSSKVTATNPTVMKQEMGKLASAEKKIDKGAGSPLTIKKDSLEKPASALIRQQEDQQSGAVVKKGNNSSPEKLSLQKPEIPSEINESQKSLTSVPVAEDKAQLQAADNVNAGKVPDSYGKSVVVRKAESSTTEGLGLTYIDTYAGGRQDTIRILIPNEDKIQFGGNGSKETDTVQNDRNASAGQVAVKSWKNGCKAVASDNDFYKLRMRMAAGKSDAAMLDEAKKSFRAKCYTTGQVRNLASLFLGDGGKYYFFDAAYPHVADGENFGSLLSELRDDYFITRFKAKIGASAQ